MNEKSGVSRSDTSPATADEPVVTVCLAGSVKHGLYVQLGAETALNDAERPSLGGLLLVVDSEGWTTAHRVTGIYRRRGRRTVKFGPRVPWPDGSIAARHIGAYAPEFEAQRQADLREADRA